MQEKAIMCLRIASLSIGPGRQFLFERSCEKFSTKAIDAKMEELARRGYIEYGTSARTGWLTVKGKAALAACPLERV